MPPDLNRVRLRLSLDAGYLLLVGSVAAVVFGVVWLAMALVAAWFVWMLVGIRQAAAREHLVTRPTRDESHDDPNGAR